MQSKARLCSGKQEFMQSKAWLCSGRHEFGKVIHFFTQAR